MLEIVGMGGLLVLMGEEICKAAVDNEYCLWWLRQVGDVVAHRVETGATDGSANVVLTIIVLLTLAPSRSVPPAL